GLPVAECASYMLESGFMQNYRSALFSRIVPVIKDIGLWGPKIRKGYEQMGILGYADTDAAAMSAKDEEVAAEFDAGRGGVGRVARAAGRARRRRGPMSGRTPRAAGSVPGPPRISRRKSLAGAAAAAVVAPVGARAAPLPHGPYDVIVVGAGLAGLTAARRLAAAGASVVVL